YEVGPYIRLLTAVNDSSELARRFRCDYRETISDLLLENFTRGWTSWAHGKGSLTRNQAHGSPGNLLDLYGTVDIPECESFGSSYFPIPGLRRDSADIRNVDPDPVMLKFASSAAHVTGKKFTSSETFTWLAEHFRVSLSQCKPEVEQLFLSGVNHVYYHGTAYSPAEAPWPGWLFYASVNFAPSNSFWPHLTGLNQYITRCQSILQQGVPNNQLLVYWPIYDVWMGNQMKDLQLTIHSIDTWLCPTPFYRESKVLMNAGYSLDFVSDRLLAGLKVEEGAIKTADGASYQTLVVPKCDYMPGSTLSQLLRLAEGGATLLFQELPADVPGLGRIAHERAQLNEGLGALAFRRMPNGSLVANIGKGRVILERQLLKVLASEGIKREALADAGVKFISRRSAEGTYYFIVNHTPRSIDQFLPLLAKGEQAILLDPNDGKAGEATWHLLPDHSDVLVQLDPGESIFVQIAKHASAIPGWKYRGGEVANLPVTTPWKLTFTKGGAQMPAARTLGKLVSWTELSDFSGTGRYETDLFLTEVPGNCCYLDLGKVCESAAVRVNGKEAGTAWCIPFRLEIGKWLHKGKNHLEIEVANLMANRIRKMDQRGIPWRNYHEINFVNINYKPFDASGWKPMPSGLLGPVTLRFFQSESAR
ncbi:MAG: hypothetical protein LWW85_13115, partial [Marinilabiliales bacterium]|nr:hypothetical protein [Marinilabiliales bacterium]